MNIIILGASGFIGTNLAIELSKDSRNKITLVARDLKSLKKTAYLCENNVLVREENLLPQSDFDSILEGQDILYHLFCSTVPTTSNKHISKEIKDNVELMSELLEACVRCHIKKIVFLSSGGTVYGIQNICPLKEELETYPINSYGMQKVMNEKLLYLYQYMHGLDYKVVRLANPFGPYQNPNGVQGVIAAFIYKALRKEEITIYGDGSSVRDYIYIDDAIHAIINIANANSKEKEFNVGSGKGVSIYELKKTIEKVLKISLQEKFIKGRTVDVPINFLDVSKYENIFGKIITVSLEEGIKKTADFIKNEYIKM